MEKTKIGIIGFGYWGPNLVRNFIEMPTAEVIAVSDLSDERLANVKASYPTVTITKNYQDLFTMGLDAVVVATPPPSHFSLVRDCLEHNLHVLVEKPITLTSRDAEELIQIADARGLVLMVGHTFEYNSAVRMLKDLIDSGELGQVYYVNAVRLNLGLFQRNLNVIWDLAPHDVSILRYILGADPINVSAHGGTCVAKVHDIAYMHLNYPGNILAHIHVSWLDPVKSRRITVVGSKKMVVYDDVEMVEKIRIYDKGVETLPYTNTFGEFHYSYRHGDVVIPHIRFTEPLRVECQHFIDCIINHTEPQSSGRVGLEIVKVLEAADRSLAANGQQEMLLPVEGLKA